MMTKTNDKKTAQQAYIEWNVDFSEPVTIKGGSLPYSDTPMVGVKRMMFERRGDEVARRATSCVRYAPGSEFKPHSHPGGEEYIVLDGTFSDQQGDFSQGWYVRNPVGSVHAPFTKDGCEIFVKLSQVPAEEEDYIYIDTNAATWTDIDNNHQQLQLWTSSVENTTLHRFKEGYHSQSEEFQDVVEIFVLSGELSINGENYQHHSWLRLPAHSSLTIDVHKNSVIYRKVGTGEVRH